MAEEISGEEHRARQESSHKRSSAPSTKTLVMALVAVLLLGGGFAAGMQYQKSKVPKVVPTTATAPSTTGRKGGRRGGLRGARPVIGQVTAVSATSITVQATSGTSTTFAITSTTAVSNNGQASAVGDIAVGDSVAVVASTTNTTQATRILLNPSFGGGSQGSGAVSN